MFLLIFFLVSLLVVGYTIPSNLVISYGESISGKVFLKASVDSLNKNDYVIVQTSPDDIFSKGSLITKKVVCSPGDVLEVVGYDYYCNLEYLGRAKLKSKTGIPVTPYNPCGFGITCKYVIPEKFYFVMGESKDSYDSRYFGLVPKEKIVAKLHKIW